MKSFSVKSSIVAYWYVAPLVLLVSAPLSAADIFQSSGFRTAALTGQSATGLPQGEVLDDFSAAVINDRGQVAFYSDFKGLPSSSHGIVMGDGFGMLRAVMRFGDPAPDGPAGAVFDTHSSPVITEHGRVGFSARLAAPGISGSDGMSLWLESTDFTPQLVAVEQFTTPPGIDPTARFSFHADHGIRLSDRGDLGFVRNVLLARGGWLAQTMRRTQSPSSHGGHDYATTSAYRRTMGFDQGRFSAA